VYAIIDENGKQFKVTEGDRIKKRSRDRRRHEDDHVSTACFSSRAAKATRRAAARRSAVLP
jgi:ribosomal protein L21